MQKSTIAIIDQTLLVDHIEYKDRLQLYKETEDVIANTPEAQMHGPAVASIAVGKSVGVAPQADLYFIATAAKISLAIFIPAYAGFDSVIGIGTGILICCANGVPINQLIVLDPAINSFWMNNIAMFLAIIGSIARGVGMSFCAVAFTEPQKRSFGLILGLIAGVLTGWGNSSSMFGTPMWWIAVLLIGAICMVVAHTPLPISLLISSGILFGTTHVIPYEPLGMACFVLAIALLEFTSNKVSVTEGMTVISS